MALQPQSLDSLCLYQSAVSSLSLRIPPAFPSSLPSPPSLPPSKLIPNTNFLVDAFRFSSPSFHSYFLSHFHSDHYSGLSPRWSHGIVFCSPTTASLLTYVLNVPSNFVFPLPLRCPVIIDGSEVTLVDANHCPGAVQFLFKVPTKHLSTFDTYVHTGDFRYCCSMKEDCHLSQFVGCNAVFLDTTYCNPKFVFPSQQESVDYVASVIGRIGGEFMRLNKRVLFLVATYVVGKEKILVEIARRCNRKVVVDERKMKVLRVLGYGDSGLFTEDDSESDVHVVGWNVLGETWPYFRPNFVKMKQIMLKRGYSKVVGFVPTGWTYEVKHNKFAVRSKDSFEIHLVPYSEHSNYDELREYVKFLSPRRVVPTVGVDVEKLGSEHACKMQKYFAGLVDGMANKKAFLMGFHGGSLENDEKGESDAVLGLNEEAEPEKEMKSSDMKEALHYQNSSIVLSSSAIMKEPGSEALTTLHEEETEKIIQELSSCLPSWVTRYQILDLIASSEQNIVEAVSIFYERETEFHDQVFAGGTNIFASQACSMNDFESFSRQVSRKSSQWNSFIHSSQNCKLANTKHMVKSGASSTKRKRRSDNLHGKKVKINTKLVSGGSKQSTITTFFNKLVPRVSLSTLESGKSNQPTFTRFFSNLVPHSLVESIPEQCPADEKLLPNDYPELYREQIEQFIQIVGGNESSRCYAASLLERTKGDTNEALNIHYSDPRCNLDERKDSLVAFGNLIQSHFHTDDCASSQEKSM